MTNGATPGTPTAEFGLTPNVVVVDLPLTGGSVVVVTSATVVGTGVNPGVLRLVGGGPFPVDLGGTWIGVTEV